ncbi:MAG: diguanylate cyclase [Syntrophomonadaceae bacterium]|nr:diguanylate cyclase [Syntrophomonadaceae bacterium]
MRITDSIGKWINSLKKPLILLYLSLTIISIAGSFFIAYTYLHSLARSKTEAVNLVMTFEAFITPEIINHLKASPADIEKPEYKQLKHELTKIAENNDAIRFAYIFLQRDGRVYFLADSEPPDSPAYSPPGQELIGFSRSDYDKLASGQTIISPLVQDKWGTWVCATVPIQDPLTGELIAACGIDYPAVTWYAEPLKHTAYSAIFVIGLFFIFIAYYRKLLSNETLRQERDKLEIMTRKLSESEELFRKVFEKAPIGIAIVNNFRFISIMNPEFEKIVSRTPAELAAINWTEMTHPENLQEDLQKFEQFKAGYIDGYEMNKRFIKPDGTTVWVKMIIAPLTYHESGSVREHLCLIEDITEKINVIKELEESERSKHMVLLNLPGMAYRCIYDREWLIQFVSEGCLEITGYKAEILQHNRDLAFYDIIVPEYREIVRKEWGRIIAEKTAFKFEYPIITASGKIRWVYEQAQPNYNQFGRVESVDGLIIDISNRKLIENKILYLNYHDFLTGLYNRRFYEDEKLRLDNEENLPLSVIIGDINGLKLINDSLGHEVGDMLIKETARILSECCRKGDILARTGGDEFTILMPRTSHEEAMTIYMIIQQAFIDEAMINENNYMNISLGYNTKERMSESLNQVIKLAEDNMYKHKLLEHKSSHSAIIATMKSTMFNISHETEAHADRLAEMARKIGAKMGLSRTEMDELELLATLHDIGKLGIDRSILNKAEPLNEAEWNEMKKHTEIGYRIAMSTQELAPIAEYILCHHEHWDGMGYPHGRKGEEIPLLSRILAVIDAYDAMTEDRVYRNALSREAALEEIRKNAGTQFDPRIVEIFLSE